MASDFFGRFLGRKKRSDEDDKSTESLQRQESPGAFSSQSRIMEIQRAEREALLHQIERLYALERAHNDAVLERLGLLNQQDHLPSPQPPGGPRQRPESSLPRWRIRPVSGVPPLNSEVVDNRWNSRTRRHQEEEAEEVHLCRDQSSGPSAPISSEDTHPPSQLRPILPRGRPVEASPPQTHVTPSPPPPVAPRPRKRASRLPMMVVNLSGADKEVSGYKLQTAEYQVEAIRGGLEHFHQNSSVPLPRPPAAPRRNPKVHPVAPAPPPKPAPAKKREPRRGTSLHPATNANGGKKTDSKCKLQRADNKNHEELQPLSNPEESLSLCFKLLSSDDWMKKVEGLRCVRALTQHHPDTLMLKLYDVCVAVTEEVKNLRSSVACAAMDTVVYLYVYLQRDMDSQAERTGRALLLKIAQSAASSFIQQQANVALEALVQNCSPGRVLNALLNTGLSHRSAAVRASTAQQLRLLADKLGADAVLTAGQSFTQRFLTAVSKMSLDAAAEVRTPGQAILKGLAPQRGFTRLWRKLIAERDRRPLEKFVKNVTRD